MNRLLVCGGRTFSDKRAHRAALSEINPTVVIHGAQRGADTLAGEWARTNGKQEIAVPACWDHLRSFAGRARNQKMLAFAPDLVLACPGGTGTANMILNALWRNIPVEKLYGPSQG